MTEEEGRSHPPPMHNKLSLVAPAFVPSRAMVLPTLVVAQIVAQTSASLNDMDNPTKSKSIGLLAKRHEPGAFVKDPLEAFDGDLDIDILDEEGHNEVLDECFAKVARDGDLSPRQQRRGFTIKKTYGRKHIWDDKVFEELILRQIPMRVAKQKETRFNYINKVQQI
ncbi:hypothetical protein RND71_023126 [Anisodus tanguticus]|uniref:Uncharacterized protein n=1 Tax=Anisodus tanguticus TaxID=243964 RepID=A0AAE1RUZ8_9SOLA|nr:hypothetical protein RND71_023126 [Anisodus tanguticus]